MKSAARDPKRPRGRPWPEGYQAGVSVHVRLPPELVDRIDRTAALDGLTRTDVIRRALETWLGLER